MANGDLVLAGATNDAGPEHRGYGRWRYRKYKALDAATAITDGVAIYVGGADKVGIQVSGADANNTVRIWAYDDTDGQGPTVGTDETFQVGSTISAAYKGTITEAMEWVWAELATSDATAVSCVITVYYKD